MERKHPNLFKVTPPLVTCNNIRHNKTDDDSTILIFRRYGHEITKKLDTASPEELEVS